VTGLGDRVRFDYLRDPAAIYRRSFEIVAEACDLDALAPADRPISARIVHSCGMPDIVGDLRFGGDVGGAVRAAVAAGRPVVVDSRMAANAIHSSALPEGARVVCGLDHPDVTAHADRLGTTRSAAGMVLLRADLDGAVVVVGNAPTALFAMLELMLDEGVRPAAILGFPVGFVGAAESKDALVAHAGDVPFVTVLGRRGGSAMAGGALNGALLGGGGA
jgi:precorrin-8X/cobalt-precorrin-8 methylmutase